MNWIILISSIYWILIKQKYKDCGLYFLTWKILLPGIFFLQMWVNRWWTTSALAPLGGIHSQFEILSSHFSSNGDENNFNKFSELKVKRDSGQRDSQSQEVGLNPFTCEQYYTYVTQDEDHENKDVGQEIEAVGKDYVCKEKSIMKMSQQ